MNSRSDGGHFGSSPGPQSDHPTQKLLMATAVVGWQKPITSFTPWAWCTTRVERVRFLILNIYIELHSGEVALSLLLVAVAFLIARQAQRSASRKVPHCRSITLPSGQVVSIPA